MWHTCNKFLVLLQQSSLPDPPATNTIATLISTSACKKTFGNHWRPPPFLNSCSDEVWLSHNSWQSRSLWTFYVTAFYQLIKYGWLPVEEGLSNSQPATATGKSNGKKRERCREDVMVTVAPGCSSIIKGIHYTVNMFRMNNPELIRLSGSDLVQPIVNSQQHFWQIFVYFYNFFFQKNE